MRYKIVTEKWWVVRELTDKGHLKEPDLGLYNRFDSYEDAERSLLKSLEVDLDNRYHNARVGRKYTIVEVFGNLTEW